MPTIDATVKLCRDGSFWLEPHWMEPCGLEDEPPKYRTVAIEDGTGDIPPMVVWILPDVPEGER